MNKDRLICVLFVYLFVALLDLVAADEKRISDSAKISDKNLCSALKFGEPLLSEDAFVQIETASSSSKKAIFLVTSKGVMYLSSDYGFSWNEQNSAMDKSSLDLARGKGIKRIVCSKANPSLCVFQGVISWFWLTDNAGVTYQIVDISDHFKRFNISYIDAMALNPQKESDILSIFVTDSCQNHLCQSMVATFDRGLTWIEVADAVLQGQWIQERDIMYLTYGSDGNTEASTTLYIYSFRDKKSQAILNDCVGFKVYDDKYLIAGQSHSGGQAVRLFYCVLVGSGCSAHELDTPRDLHYSRFSVLSVNKDRLYVNGNDGTTKLGDILLSKVIYMQSPHSGPFNQQLQRLYLCFHFN
eukprot:TRINITY_DN4294_c0_g1_i4.p1 TRINITY_DN4294_c0_g1~~TRINITY_DN4294_c0_g1_i4.p1  ORF type:complete len:356 (-),score=59.27 TRINITY_DN4294_c0_g1_i4:1557-2624(-)